MDKYIKKRWPQYPEKVTSVFLGLMFSVYLLWPGTAGYEHIDEAKYRLFLVLAGGYVIVMLILGMEMTATGLASFPDLRAVVKKLSWAQLCLILFLGFTALSALLSPYWPDTLFGMERKEGLVTITIYVSCFFLVGIFGRWRPHHLYIGGISTSLFCLLCMLQLSGFNPFQLYPAGYNYFDADKAYSGAYLGTIGNVDLVASFLCLTAPLFLCAAIFNKGKGRGLLLIPAFLSIAVLLWMKVAAGYVGFFVGMCLAVPLLFRAVGKPAKTPLITVICIFAALIAALYFVDVGTGTLHEFHEILHWRWDESFGSGRLHIWKEALGLARENPWLGGGPDTLALRMNAPFTRYAEELDLTLVAVIDAAHNEYLNVLVCQGVFALASYGVALVCTAAAAVKKAVRSRTLAILAASLLCYCIQAFFGISSFFTAPFFWILWGLTGRELYRGEKK